MPKRRRENFFLLSMQSAKALGRGCLSGVCVQPMNELEMAQAQVEKLKSNSRPVRAFCLEAEIGVRSKKNRKPKAQEQIKKLNN